MELDLFPITREVAYRLTAVAGGWLSFVLIAWGTWRLRHPQPLRVVTPLIGIAAAAGSVAAYLALSGLRPDPIAAALIAALGALGGLLALTLVRVEDGQGGRLVRRAHWFLLPWGLGLAAVQAAGALDSRGAIAVGMAATLLSAGLLGTLSAGLLLWRLRST